MKGTNPATGATIETYDAHDEGQVEDRHSSAEPTFESVKDWSVAERETTRAAIATLLRERTDEYAELMPREVGKPNAQAEIETCAWVCERDAEEVFGPVVAVYRVPDEDAGIKEYVNRKTAWREPPAARDRDEVPTE